MSLLFKKKHWIVSECVLELQLELPGVQSGKVLVNKGWCCFCIKQTINSSVKQFSTDFKVECFFDCKSIKLWGCVTGT